MDPLAFAVDLSDPLQVFYRIVSLLLVLLDHLYQVQANLLDQSFPVLRHIATQKPITLHALFVAVQGRSEPSYAEMLR